MSTVSTSTIRSVTMASLVLTLIVANAAFSAVAEETWNAPLVDPAGALVARVVMVEDQDGDAVRAGAAAAKALVQAMGEVAPKVVIISECFEDREYKEKLLQGICSVLDRNVVFGGATYGSFAQQGCTDFDSVCLLGLGGDGIGISAGLVTQLGTAKLSFDEHEQEIKQRLHQAGDSLVKAIRRHDQDRLLVLIPDAHSPKNRYLVEGVQRQLGPDFPMTGGSANKNAGQTFVYYRGRLYQDSAVALMLSGAFRITMSGRLAQDNAGVIRTAREGAAEALGRVQDKQPLVVLAYNCAGRRSKLEKMEDELAAIQEVIGDKVPLFGCYNAGEIGPLDPVERQAGVRCGGSGWHVMFTMLWRD